MLLVALAAQYAHAFGPLGHSTVAAIATKFLSADVKTAVNALLANQPMSNVSSWADQVLYAPNSTYTWSANLHYADVTTPGRCYYMPSLDCANAKCVTGAIANYSSRLAVNSNLTMSFDQRVEALKFLIHFLGDVHQPLHVGQASNQGGNTISVILDNTSMNLHSVWDSGLLTDYVQATYGNNVNWVDSLSQDLYLTLIKPDMKANMSTWAACDDDTWTSCIARWANESARYACSAAYVDENNAVITNGRSLSAAYANRAYPILREQLMKGGLRLASLLNNILAPTPLTPTLSPPSGNNHAGHHGLSPVAFVAIIAVAGVVVVGCGIWCFRRRSIARQAAFDALGSDGGHSRGTRSSSGVGILASEFNDSDSSSTKYAAL